MPDNIKGQQTFQTGASSFNASAFQIQQALNKINTAEPVRVTGVSGGGKEAVGTVTVQPLVNLVTGAGEGLEQSTLFQLPYLRIQGGENAVICDPKVGDIGLAVYAMRDTEAVKSSRDGVTANPGSARAYSKGDGFYLGGFLNKAPKRLVWVEDDGITVEDGEGGIIELKAGACKITAPNGVTMETPTVTITGTLTTTGTSGSGNMSVNGSITSTGDQVAAGISQTSHVHTSVEPGSGTSGGPI